MLQIKFKQTGFTLVELMISIVLGLLLTAAVIQSYLGTKQTYRMNDGISRIQENARFSLYFLSKDLRNAGQSSCISRVRNKLDADADDYLSFKSAVTGWDATNTQSGQTFTLTGNTAADNQWKNGGLPTYLSGKVIAGSDVLSFKNYTPLDVNIDSNQPSANQIGTVGAHGIEAGSILLVGNCWQTELFQSRSAATSTSLTAPNGSGDPGNRNLGSAPWLRTYTPQDSVFGLQKTIYYIGTGASGLPALFRYQTYAAQIANTNDAQELVEGVESMQIFYGEDTDAILDGFPNLYVSADQVGNWDNIVSVRIGLLLRSTNNVTDIDQGGNYTLLDGITLTHSDDDNILRYSVNSTIKLRNSGLNADLAYYVCDATADTSDDTPECT